MVFHLSGGFEVDEDERARRIGNLTIERKKLRCDLREVEERISKFRKAITGMGWFIDGQDVMTTYSGEGRGSKRGGPFPSVDEIEDAVQERNSLKKRLDEIEKELADWC